MKKAQRDRFHGRALSATFVGAVFTLLVILCFYAFRQIQREHERMLADLQLKGTTLQLLSLSQADLERRAFAQVFSRAALALDPVLTHGLPLEEREIEWMSSGGEATPVAILGESEGAMPPETAVPVGMALKEVERELIRKTLEPTGGNRTKAAEVLGISRATLHNRLKEYGLS